MTSSSGNVGIGIEAPTKALQVAGTLSAGDFGQIINSVSYSNTGGLVYTKAGIKRFGQFTNAAYSGDGTTENYGSTTALAGVNNPVITGTENLAVKQVTMGHKTYFALLEDGTLKSWLA